MNVTPPRSTPIDMKSPRLRSGAPLPAVQFSPDTQTGLTWTACGVAWTTVNEGDELAALRLCAKSMYHGPLLLVTGAGFVVAYHASAARPDDPAVTDVNTALVPGRLTVAGADHVFPPSPDAESLTLSSLGSIHET